MKFDPYSTSIQRLYFNSLCTSDKGVTVGRYANRIAKGELYINEEYYQLAVNENQNTLHRSPVGFGKRLWTQESRSDENSVIFYLTSDDTGQGFPVTKQIKVCYTLEESAVTISYWAISDKDTAINLTNHAYSNLNGIDCAPLASKHELYIEAGSYLEVDTEPIPTGKLISVCGTDFDFRRSKRYTKSCDHNSLLNAPKVNPSCAVLRGCQSGVNMSVFTDRPGIQLYNTDTQIYLEMQNFPDAMHHKHFPSPSLKTDMVFQSTTAYRFAQNQK